MSPRSAPRRAVSVATTRCVSDSLVGLASAKPSGTLARSAELPTINEHTAASPCRVRCLPIELALLPETYLKGCPQIPVGACVLAAFRCSRTQCWAGGWTGITSPTSFPVDKAAPIGKHSFWFIGSAGFRRLWRRPDAKSTNPSCDYRL